ncbi:linear amide C-N hydrolase [Chlorogloeopsis fritschii PCC 9212]|jgi:penicillin V acylase-like amidase (Ntn superfamily)|uniref:linear amide C-N hydrolase n=1 Tax=Chlorogloeopsis fritschii TaxID=1124 RepID=UPI0002E80A3C|nr:linear amide C-N hydrolase [Chlorogloeopsis fritschii]
MKKITIGQVLCGALATLVAGLMPMEALHACTRVVYLGPQSTIVTARSMDWASDMGTNLWAFPRGMKRDGAAGANSIRWTSKYGSVVAAGFDAGTADGMNEKGLVANLLYLAESEYVKPTPNDKRKPLSVSAWTQYVLDNYATVAEAVKDLRKEPFYVVPTMTPDGKPGQLHLSISDATGDSAIFEYVGGKLNIHHSREYQVMTNSPVYDQQIALNKYWEQIGGTTMLPGTNRAADRFVRASFYINAIPKTSNINEAIAAAFSVIRNASVPLGISTPGQPNISSTLWRTVSDHKNKRYFFESTRSPNVFWVNLSDMDFAEGKPTKKLTLTNGAVFAGNTAAQFKPAEPFKFLAAEVK